MHTLCASTDTAQSGALSAPRQLTACRAMPVSCDAHACCATCAAYGGWTEAACYRQLTRIGRGASFLPLTDCMHVHGQLQHGGSLHSCARQGTACCCSLALSARPPAAHLPSSACCRGRPGTFRQCSFPGALTWTQTLDPNRHSGLITWCRIV